MIKYIMVILLDGILIAIKMMFIWTFDKENAFDITLSQSTILNLIGGNLKYSKCSWL